VNASVDALWLATLQKLSAHVAHDLKGALNSVSVNLEVVRSRSERESSTGADVHRYAANAADQMAIVIRATTALLSLARGTRGPVEVSMVAKQLASLLDDMSSAAGGHIKVSVEGGMSAETAAPISLVRLALAECLLATVSGKEPVSVRVAGIPAPRVLIGPATHTALSPNVEAALWAAGIEIGTDGHGISIQLPGPPDYPTEDA
jgi:signal transduction histidine kinase